MSLFVSYLLCEMIRLIRGLDLVCYTRHTKITREKVSISANREIVPALYPTEIE